MKIVFGENFLGENFISEKFFWVKIFGVKIFGVKIFWVKFFWVKFFFNEIFLTPPPSRARGRGEGGEVVDRPTQLFYIWIFICNYTKLINTAGQSSRGKLYPLEPKWMRLMLSGILSYLDPMQCGDWWCDTAWVNWMKNIPKYSFVRSSLALQKWAIVIAWDMGAKMQKNSASPFIQEISRKIYVSSFYRHLGSGFK